MTNDWSVGSRSSADLVQLARAIVSFAPLAQAGYPRSAFPAEVHGLLSPFADAGNQVLCAQDLLQVGLADSREPALIEAVIILYSQATAELGDDHEWSPNLWSNLGIALMTRFVNGHGTPADLDQAIAACGRAVRISGSENLDLYLRNLRTAYRRRLDHGNGRADLDAEIEVGERLIDATAPDDPDLGSRFNALANSYQQRFDLAHSPEDLDRAIAAREQAVSRVSALHPARIERRIGLIVALFSRFELTDSLRDLEYAIRLCLEDGRDESDNLSRLSMLNAFQNLHDDLIGRDPSAIDLDTLIRLRTLWSRGRQSDENARRARLTSLARAHDLRFERDGNLLDLDATIEIASSLLADFSAEALAARKRAALQAALGSYHTKRFPLSRARADLDLAVDYGEKCLASIGTDDPQIAHHLNTLASAYRLRFEHFGALADLDRAIACDRRGVDLVDGDERAVALSNLGNLMRTRFERVGGLADLDDAISAGSAAVAAAPDYAFALSNLSNAYRLRFIRTGDPADLDRAVDLAERAVSAARAQGRDAAPTLNTLASAYLLRADRDAEPADVDRAIRTAEQAIAATPATDPRLASRLGNLGSMYHTRFNQASDPADLDRALELGEQALAAAPANGAERVGYLANVGLGYLDRSKLRTAPDDLDRAVAAIQQAADDPAANEATRGGMLYNLSLAFATRSNRQVRTDLVARSADLGRAVAAAEQALAITPEQHVLRTTVLAQLAFLYRLRMSTGRELEPGRLQSLLHALSVTPESSRVRSIPAMEEIGVLAELVGEQETALSLFDRAMGLMQSVTSREDADPGGKYLGLVGEAIAAHCAVGDSAGAVEAAERGGIIEPSPRFFADAAVLVNVGRLRRDAVIITADADPVSVALVDVTEHDVQDRASILDSEAAPRELSDLLAWLWDAFVAPIHDALPISVTSASAIPLVYWIPVGTLQCFPFHAAGRVGEPGALDHMTSLYTPVLRALDRARGLHHAIGALWPLDEQVVAVVEAEFRRSDVPNPAALRAVTLALRAQHPDRPDLWAPLIHVGPHSRSSQALQQESE